MKNAESRPEQARNLGEEARAAYMEPGEQFEGNWSRPNEVSVQGMGGLTTTVHQQVNDLLRTGKYDSVRTIPAFTTKGNVIPDMEGIVVRPKPKEPGVSSAKPVRRPPRVGGN